MFTKYVSNPTEYRHFKYKQFRNKVSYELKKAKTDYLRNKVALAAGNIKNTWKIVNSMMGTRTNRNGLPT